MPPYGRHGGRGHTDRGRCRGSPAHARHGICRHHTGWHHDRDHRHDADVDLARGDAQRPGVGHPRHTAYENLGTLNPGQTKQLTVVFTARTGFNLWGWHPGHRFTVRVVGSAASYGNWRFIGQRVSYSTAYVTIIPWGFWW
jgi:hypothetical protein